MALAILLIPVFTGCSNPDSKYSKVEGIITYNGAPVAEATISFMSTSSDSESASGITGADGKFMLTSVQAVAGGSGAMPGDYTVTITKREAAPTDPDQDAYDRGEIDYNELQSRQSRRDSYASRPVPKSLIPVKYGSPATSGLTATVKSGKNEPFNFDLTD